MTPQTHHRPRSAVSSGRTATSILASNAYLNPLLERNLGSARAFSTTPGQYVDAFDAKMDYRNPTDDAAIAALINKKRSSLGQKKPAPRHTSHKTLQATQKPQLMYDLASSSQDTPDSADLTPELLEAKLADLARQLEAAKLVDWDALYQDAQEARSLKNHPDYDYENMQQSHKVIATRKLAEEYDARVKEIKLQREEHQHHVSELKKDYARLRLYVERQRAGEHGERGEGESSEHFERIEEVKRRKEEVLRKKDELEVRLARLRAMKAGIRVTAADAPDTLAAADAASDRSLSASSLHLDLPNGTFCLDSITTFSIHTTPAKLEKQLSKLRSRLSVFHPRLDALPSDINAGPDAEKGKHTLQTYLKVLIARYREKTGVLGVREHGAEETERRSDAEGAKENVTAKTLTQEAMQRIAGKWNEMFSKSKGYIMTPERMEQGLKAMETTEKQRPQGSKAEADGKAKASRETEVRGRAAVRGHGTAAPQQRFEPEIEEFNEHGFLEDEHATEEAASAADETERVQLSRVEQTAPVEGKDSAETQETGENEFLASAHEMNAEEDAIKRTAQASASSKEVLPPSNETIEADKNDADAALSASSLHSVAGTKDSSATTLSPTAPMPTSPQQSRTPRLPIPTSAKPRTHAYFGRRFKIYSDIEKRLRRIEKKKTVKYPVGMDTPVSPEVTAAIDAELRDFLDEFDERLKQNKIEDTRIVRLVRRVRGGGDMAERQKGKIVSPSYWADRFGILKQQRMRESPVDPPVSPRSKLVKSPSKASAQDLTDMHHAAATKATAFPPSGITATDPSESAPANSSHPARNDPSFAARALNQPSGGPSASQTSEQARETLEANRQAVKFGWGAEDERIAAEGLPEQSRPDVKMQGYEFMGDPRYDSRESSVPALEARVQASTGTSTETESEEDRLAQDPNRKARIANELKLLRRATTLRQEEDEPEAASGQPRGAQAETQKPLITYESSLQPKGFVMKRQRGAVAEQKQKINALMNQNPVQTRLATSSRTQVGARTQTDRRPQPRRPLTVREVMRRSYSTSAQALDELNEALEKKEDSALKEPTPSPPASAFAKSPPQPQAQAQQQAQPHLPHLTPSGAAHMVSISSKSPTARTAIAVGTVYFSNPTPLTLITSNALKKGDVLSVSRIAGIMAAKKCPDIVPLCHPIALTHVGVELRTFSPGHAPVSASPAGKGNDELGHGGVKIEAKVACTGATGVEMEALTAVMGTALSVVDMCKAVDKFQRIGDVRVVLKEGGKSGVWKETGWQSWNAGED